MLLYKELFSTFGSQIFNIRTECAKCVDKCAGKCVDKMRRQNLTFEQPDLKNHKIIMRRLLTSDQPASTLFVVPIPGERRIKSQN